MDIQEIPFAIPFRRFNLTHLLSFIYGIFTFKYFAFAFTGNIKEKILRHLNLDAGSIFLLLIGHCHFPAKM